MKLGGRLGGYKYRLLMNGKILYEGNEKGRYVDCWITAARVLLAVGIKRGVEMKARTPEEQDGVFRWKVNCWTNETVSRSAALRRGMDLPLEEYQCIGD